MKTVRILIADDHEIVREGVRAILRRDPRWEVCGEASNGREAVAEAERLEPEIVVMDVGMPELNGLEATRQIKKKRPETEVLIFTSNETEEIVRGVFQAGARAYLLKSEAGNHLVPAIEALCERQTYFSSKVSALVFAGYLKNEPAASGPLLTPRERETVQLIAEGKSNKEMAEILEISVKTVETHRATIMRKLSLDSIADVVRYAVRNGIIAV